MKLTGAETESNFNDEIEKLIKMTKYMAFFLMPGCREAEKLSDGTA